MIRDVILILCAILFIGGIIIDNAGMSALGLGGYIVWKLASLRKGNIEQMLEKNVNMAIVNKECDAILKKWYIGFKDRGHGDFAVITKKNLVVVEARRFHEAPLKKKNTEKDWTDYYSRKWYIWIPMFFLNLGVLFLICSILYALFF